MHNEKTLAQKDCKYGIIALTQIIKHKMECYQRRKRAYMCTTSFECQISRSYPKVSGKIFGASAICSSANFGTGPMLRK